MDRFTTRTPGEVNDIAKTKQATYSKAKKKARENSVKYIARWFYEAKIVFHNTTLPSF